MTSISRIWKTIALSLAVSAIAHAAGIQVGETEQQILTPPSPAEARIHGPTIYGERPGRPFLYTIPVTGERPIQYTAEGLPDGLTLEHGGRISGSVKEPGTYLVKLSASNSKGSSDRTLKIVIGDTIALTPPMGWNSWNCWGSKVSAEKVMSSAKGMVDSGLINHGWTYINIDDAWQANERGGEFHAIQGNSNFPDMKGFCDSIHGMGLKVGIYSTPWTTSYATHIGGSSENEDGAWSKPTIPKKGNVNKKILPWAVGKYSFASNDAKQWAAWGIDYLKYDWNPNEFPETNEMYQALLGSGRDVVLSLSNSTPFKNISELSKIATCWRTSGDIRDTWKSVSGKLFSEDKWEPYCSPGHWNDPDMLVVGYVGWGQPHPSGLTANEQYTHISQWCLLSAPLLLGCDLSKVDAFTLSLLTNDEVIEVDQDALGKQALPVGDSSGELKVYAKDLEDGSKAVGLFNTSEEDASVAVSFNDLKVSGSQAVRDLWRQKNLGDFTDKFEAKVGPHGVVLVKVSAAK
jgi:alpha-galactosidase